MKQDTSGKRCWYQGFGYAPMTTRGGPEIALIHQMQLFRQHGPRGLRLYILRERFDDLLDLDVKFQPSFVHE
jgi:hypothetical protein